MIYLLLLGVTLLFTDTSGVEKGFLVQHVKANGEFVFLTVPPMPSTGGVKFTLDAAPGDCFYVYAFNEGPLSAPSNRACVALAAPNPPAAPSGASVGP